MPDWVGRLPGLESFGWVPSQQRLLVVVAWFGRERERCSQGAIQQQ
jgi:hypothetical protein